MRELKQETQTVEQATTLSTMAMDGEKSGANGLGTANSKIHRSIAYCDGLIDILSAYFDVSGRAIRSPRRQSLAVARVRQIGMYIANVVLGINMTTIGQGFGRNKSTVIHACHLIEDMRDDEEFDQIIARLEAIVHAAFKFSLAEDNLGDKQ